jgi:hypothetical protein
MIRNLKTVADVVAALGGNRAVGQRYGYAGERGQAVVNWKRVGRIPPELYLSMTADLRRRKCRAPSRLWQRGANVRGRQVEARAASL